MSKSINLLPDKVLDTQREITQFYAGTVVVIIGLVLFFLLNLVVYFLSVSANNSLLSLKQEESALYQEIASYDQVELKLYQFRDKLFRYNRFRRDNVATEKIWNDIYVASQGTVVIDSLIFRDKSVIEIQAHTDSLTRAVAFLIPLHQGFDEETSRLRITGISYDGFDDVYSFTAEFLITL